MAEVVEGVPADERLVIGADFNGHVGEGNRGEEDVLGEFGLKERNAQGQMLVDFAKIMKMYVVNTHFQKNEEERVTFMSGGRYSQIDYVLIRSSHPDEIVDSNVIQEDGITRQHRMVVCTMKLEI